MFLGVRPPVTLHGDRERNEECDNQSGTWCDRIDDMVNIHIAKKKGGRRGGFCNKEERRKVRRGVI